MCVRADVPEAALYDALLDLYGYLEPSNQVLKPIYKYSSTLGNPSLKASIKGEEPSYLNTPPSHTNGCGTWNLVIPKSLS
jgi:hypothetical protein